MSVQLDDDDVVARLRAGAPGCPATGPDAGLTLAAARRALRRNRMRRALGGVAMMVTVLFGLTVIGPVELPGVGTLLAPFGFSDSLPDQGDPPVYRRERMLDDVARLELHVLPVTEELKLSRYLYEPGAWGHKSCRVLAWSQGDYRDRHPDCAGPQDRDLPLDAATEAAFGRVSGAIGDSGVGVYRIEKGGWGPGVSFHLRDDSWRWNWYYSYIPGTPPDAPAEERTDTKIGVRLKVHVSGHWWFTVEPDD